MKDYDVILQALADKFGTTVEHLWGVMVSQASISALTDIAVIAVLIGIVIWGFRFVKAKTTKPFSTEDNRYPSAEWGDEAMFCAWLIWGIWR